MEKRRLWVIIMEISALQLQKYICSYGGDEWSPFCPTSKLFFTLFYLIFVIDTFWHIATQTIAG